MAAPKEIVKQAGKTGQVIAQEIGSTSRTLLSESAQTFRKALDNQKYDIVEKWKYRQKGLDVNKDVSIAKQKHFTKRHDTLGRVQQSWINESDEILNALDSWGYKRSWKKRGVYHELKISPMKLCALGTILKGMGMSQSNPILQQIGATYERQFDYLINHAQDLNRLASAGNMTFGAPDIETAVDQATGIIDTSENGDGKSILEDLSKTVTEEYEHVTETNRALAEVSADYDKALAAYLAYARAVEEPESPGGKDITSEEAKRYKELLAEVLRLRDELALLEKK